MMKKAVFEKNLAELVVSDDMTVAEARKIRVKKNALVNKVKKNLADHVRLIDDKDYQDVGGYFFVFPQFKLKANGSLTVRVMFDNSGWGDFGAKFMSDTVVAEHRVKMSDIMN